MKSGHRVFLLDDDELIVSMLARSLKKSGFEVFAETDPEDWRSKLEAFTPDVLLLDIRMPGYDGLEILQQISDSPINTQVVMLTSDDTAETAVKAMKMGAADYLTKPFNKDEVKMVIDNVIENQRLRQEVRFLRDAYTAMVEKDIIGESEAIQNLLAQAERIAKAQVDNILITGESGTGKEVLARHIHGLMTANDTEEQAPFISVNCAAMPETLLESELFGYQKGSFTDAKSDKKGLFELAAGGSILLDEIGDMKLELQSKLLRVLEGRTVRRIGGKGEVAIDVTVMATTNKDLSEAVQNGEFRKDLFFRLSPFYLHIVPLRERREDIPLLAQHFLDHFKTKYNNKHIKGFSPAAEEILANSSWPGNIRELKNMVERIVVLETAEVIGSEHIPRWISSGVMVADCRPDNGFMLPDEGIDLENLEKNLVKQALEKAKNNKALAAKLLNISYDSIRYQVKKFNL
ncbi:MAG: sigma-54 dependent transcriptional regulator [Desulfobacteraceae bacterium]